MFTLLLASLLLLWYFSDAIETRETLTAMPGAIRVADGDSFSLGARKLRLNGIDSPEYRQTCADAQGRPWDCGKAARAALERLLLEPGLKCDAGARDRYNRALARCTTDVTDDVAAAQVRAGFAMTHEFEGMRDYGDEEDAAREARRGIWQGSFVRPDDWRASQRQ